MEKSFSTKLLYSILAMSSIILLGFMVYLFVTLFGGFKFYAPLVILVTIVLAIYAVAVIFNLLSKRIRHIALVSFAGLCLLAITGYELNKLYIKSFAVVSEQEVNLYQYAPFEQGTKTVSLEESASYHIDKELPRLDGATALYPLYSAFVQAVYPAGKYNPNELEDSPVLCTTTSSAYQRLIAGEADIIFAAAPSLAQQKAATRAGIELNLTPIGREAFVFFVASNNPISGLTTAQIKDIYSGKITNWQDVGGKHDRIRAFQRAENSGSQTMLEKVMGDTPIMTPPQEDVVDMMSGIIQQTSSYRNYKNAIGFSFLFYASEMNASAEIALLAVDGVQPSKENICSGQYPFNAEFYAVTAGSTNPNVQPFLEWIVSAKGQELVEKTGYVSVR